MDDLGQRKAGQTYCDEHLVLKQACEMFKFVPEGQRQKVRQVIATVIAARRFKLSEMTDEQLCTFFKYTTEPVSAPSTVSIATPAIPDSTSSTKGAL